MKPKFNYYSFNQAAEYLTGNAKKKFSEEDVLSLIAEGFFISGHLNRNGKYVFLGIHDYHRLREKGNSVNLVVHQSLESVLYGAFNHEFSGSDCDAEKTEDLTICREELDEFLRLGDKFDDRRTLIACLKWYIKKMTKKENDKRPLKQIYLPQIIKYILTVLEFKVEGFDRDQMPGVKKEFLGFCNLLSQREFSLAVDTFSGYLKRRKPNKSICSWSRSAKSNKIFWAEVGDQFKTEKLNSFGNPPR